MRGENGALDRIRTCDPLIKSQLLYRLSYERIPIRSAPARKICSIANQAREING